MDNKQTNKGPGPRGQMGGMGVSEKPKNFKNAMIKLFRSLKGFKTLILVSIILAMVSSIFSIISPNKLSDLTDKITLGLIPNMNETTIKNIMSSKDITMEDKLKFQTIMSKVNKNSTNEEKLQALDSLPKSIKKVIEPKVDLDGVKSIAILLLFIFAASFVFNYGQGFIMASVSNNFSRELRNKISLKINKLPLKYFDNHNVGDTLSRVTNDVDMIGQSMNQSLVTVVSSITMFIGSIIMMFYTNWIMAITAIVSSLVGFAFMAVILTKSQKYFIERQKRLGEINGHIEETYAGLIAVKVYNGKKDSDKKFDEYNHAVFNCDQKSQFLSGLMQPIMVFIGNFSYVAVCIVGALLVINGNITFGVIVAFIMYARLFTNPLAQMAQAMTSLQSTAAASERVFEFLDEKEMLDESDKEKHLNRKTVKGEIEFEHIRFGYDENKIIIKDFNVNVKPGQKIAIVGPTGAGKTTMVNLLMKFYEVNSGDIKIDGVSLKDLTRENIHELFTMVLQDTWLFNGTIKENIVYNRKNVSQKRIEEICKTVGIDHFIKTLPNNYDSVLSDNESISSGQKQLITIARGMIEDAPFLILDEATSNVDTRTEELVQQAMDKLTGGKTSFIIAHRLSTIKNADLILVMNEGNIIETGNHEELMKQNSFYADLYNSQFSKVGMAE